MTTEIKFRNGQIITLNGEPENSVQYRCDGLLFEDFGNLLHLVGAGNLSRLFSNAYKYINGEDAGSEKKSTALFRQKATLFPNHIQTAVGVLPNNIDRVVFSPK